MKKANHARDFLKKFSLFSQHNVLFLQHNVNGFKPSSIYQFITNVFFFRTQTLLAT